MVLPRTARDPHQALRRMDGVVVLWAVPVARPPTAEDSHRGNGIRAWVPTIKVNKKAFINREAPRVVVPRLHPRTCNDLRICKGLPRQSTGNRFPLEA